MRACITGGCGFLGHHLVEHVLKHTDWEVVIVDRLSYASAGFDRLRDIEAFDESRVTVLAADLTSDWGAGLAKEVGEVDWIFHLAAETHVDRSIVDPVPFIRANVLGTHSLLWLARRQRHLRRAFLVSTDEVYGPAAPGAVGFTEIDRFRPTNPYAAAKAGGECLAMAYAHCYRIPLTIVNTMNLFGERQHPEKFIPGTLRKVLRGERVTIHADPSRKRAGSRFYLHCRNFSAALHYFAGLAEAGRDLPVKIHVAGEEEVDNLALARRIAEVAGAPLDYEMVDFHSSRPGHDLRYALDDGLARSLGWNQPVGFDESLARTICWYLRPENRKWIEWADATDEAALEPLTRRSQ